MPFTRRHFSHQSHLQALAQWWHAYGTIVGTVWARRIVETGTVPSKR